MSPPEHSTADRSVLRRLRRSGDTTRDGRGRIHPMPPILQYGFRPFFFLASLHAGLAIPAWLWMYLTGLAPYGPFAGLDWHTHEMLFGYLGAVTTGFILTAIPNWTGRLPLSGWPLAGLVVLWLSGRIANVLVADPWAAAAVDLAFPATLAFAVWREVVASRNWKNAPVATLITLFGIANALHHAENLGFGLDGLGMRLALGVAAMLIALMGGRIVPSFTRNWLVKRGETSLPAAIRPLDQAALASMALGSFLWIIAPETKLAGAALLAAGALTASRLALWKGHRTWSEPILLILHIAYGWLAVSVALLGTSGLTVAFPTGAALHALTAGAIGTMTLAVMTRASLGHTGREIIADRAMIAIYLAVTLGAALRVAAPLAGNRYAEVLLSGGALWSIAFLLFALRFAPVLLRARIAR